MGYRHAGPLGALAVTGQTRRVRPDQRRVQFEEQLLGVVGLQISLLDGDLQMPAQERSPVAL